MKYKAAIFDLDGTLLDTIEDLCDSMNYVLEQMGCPTHSIEKYKYFVGDGMRNLVLRALPEDKRDKGSVESALAAMRNAYSKRWDVKSRPYPGITDLLDALACKGIKLSVLSNKVDDITKMIIKKLLPSWNFYPVFGERQGVPRKPDPAGALEIAHLLGVEPGECLYLGDTGVDMKTATAAGMYAVGVLWGFRKAEELVENGARTLISHPLDLLSHL
ncbi:MAG: HAD family hydrolase [Acetivibrionales bacterium]|jgi:phosphoglycolate phosphatase